MRIKIFLIVACTALLALPAALAASPSNLQTANQACSSLRSSLGAGNFKLTYGTNVTRSNAFGQCLAKMLPLAVKAAASANAACQAEQADVNFAASHGGKTFVQFYGHGKKDSNAFGKCVSTKVQASIAVAKAAVVNGARACKAELKTLGTAAFAAKYGKNGVKRNAFGKCVVVYVKAHQA